METLMPPSTSAKNVREKLAPQDRCSIDKADPKPACDATKQGFYDECPSNPRSSNGSVFYDSDATNLSSSANSTLRSELSSTYTKPTREETLATLDNYILDVSQVVERAKEQEKRAKKEMKQVKREEKEEKRPRSKTSVIKTFSSDSDASIRKWNSMPSVTSTDGIGVPGSCPPQSCLDVRSPEYEVFSDSELNDPKSKAFKFKKSHKIDSSMSSNVSDVPDTYGIAHLNQLCKFLEGYKQLQIENTELSKRVNNLEENYLKKASPKYENLLGGEVPPPPRNSMVFPVPKEKPKKTKAGKFKGLNPKEKAKTGYQALTSNLPLIFSTRSFDNLKLSSSQNFEKFKEKQSRLKKQEKYSYDDLEVGKSTHETDDWRNASVKTPSKDAETSLSDYIDIVMTTGGHQPPPSTHVVGDPIVPTTVPQLESSPPPSTQHVLKNEKSPDVNKKVFPTKPTSPAKENPEERNYKNVKKMTEWGALQEAFPVPQMESNVDLLNHLEAMVTSSKVARKTSHKKHGPGRLVHKKHKKPTTNMYLPSTPIQGFASTCLAAHAMANQLTLALNLTDLDALSTTDVDNPQPSASSQPIPIP